METLASSESPVIIIVAKLLDPLMFIIAAVMTLPARRWWHVPIIGLVVALISETILISMQELRVWGQSLIPGVIAYSIHSAIAFWAMKKWRRRHGKPVTPDHQHHELS